jgi:site-specific DNA-methyltransferase (adenine-specific)
MLENYGINIYNRDCLEAMKEMPDNAFDLAICDPPYGIDVNMNMGRRKGMGKKHNAKEWDAEIPSELYFKELERVSNNQIIWGANYFNMPPNRGFIIWDKMIPEDLSFAMCEFAWTSFDKVAKIFRKPIQTDNSNRIHPTQKPVALYKWLIDKYAKEGDKILDTHLGSGSIAIACYEYGFNLTGFELDTDYFNAAKQRVENHIQSHPKLF